MPKLTDTKLVVLSAAAQQPDRLAAPPKLPAAAQAAVGRSLLKAGLLALVPLPAARTAFAWKLERDATTGLAITDQGLEAIGVELEPPQERTTAPNAGGGAVPQAEPAEAPQGAPRATLRALAAAVLAAWDADRNALAGAVEALRAALAKPGRQPGPRQPRTGTKQQAVITLLRRPEGATIAQVMDATGWQPHTVRGFLAGLKKRGIQVSVLERIRQVGPNKEGAHGSFTVYRVDARGPAAPKSLHPAGISAGGSSVSANTC
jgi:hypothetical protein